MSNPFTANQFVQLGRIIQNLSGPANFLPNVYQEEIKNLLAQLVACDLKIARIAAKSLEGITIPAEPLGKVSSVAAGSMQLLVRGVNQAISDEAGDVRLLPLDSGGVSERLRSLPAQLALSPIQTTLQVEAVRCLECGAYRAAMVMAWNLAFDYIRQWIFDLHLTVFNNTLTSSYTKRNGKPQYEAVSSYNDFFTKSAPAERIILDVANDGNLIGGELYDHLCQYLRYRNNYAHPNFKVITRDQTNAAIEHLIDIIHDRHFVRAPI
jgi:hypothetical protein